MQSFGYKATHLDRQKEKWESVTSHASTSLSIAIGSSTEDREIESYSCSLAVEQTALFGLKFSTFFRLDAPLGVGTGRSVTKLNGKRPKKVRL